MTNLDAELIKEYNIPPALLEGIVNNQVIPFIGAGFSKNANMPGGKTMPDWKEMGAFIAGLMEDYQYDNAVDAFSFYEYSNSRDALIRQLRKKIVDPEVKPGKVHKTLLKLFDDSLIFTTNYDTLIEDAAKDLKTDCPVISCDKGIVLADENGSKLVKLHGDFSNPEAMVITEKDYDLYLTQHPMLSVLIGNTFLTKTILFIGYSFNDSDFRSIWNLIGNKMGSYGKNAYCILINESLQNQNKFKIRNVNPVNIQCEDGNYGEALDALLEKILKYKRIRLNQKNEERKIECTEWFVNNYVGKKYMGKDPWGGYFSIEIRGYEDGNLKIKWLNQLIEPNYSIEKDVLIPINENMIGEFNILEKVYVYDDTNAFFEYSYSGVVQLVNNKVFVTFNGGQCRKYLEGGSGMEGYNYSGAYRNGANLIAILDVVKS